MPDLQMDYMFLGRKDEPGTICIAHAVDIDFGQRIVIRADEGPVEYVIRAICEMLQEIGRKQIIIGTDGEPSARALVVAVSAFREEETVLEMTSKDNSQGIGTVERGSFLVGATARVLRASVEEKLQWKLPLEHPVINWLVRHCGWLLNRFGIGHDGKTSYERATGETLQRRDLRAVRNRLVEGR